jgi:hypothetical protein
VKDSNPTSSTTRREPVVVIAEAIASVCSDGNSDALRVAHDVLEALSLAGYSLVLPVKATRDIRREAAAMMGMGTK